MSISRYKCLPCSEKLGRVVGELVRMSPLSMVVDGKVIAPEVYCCPICYEPKFDARTKKSVKRTEPLYAAPKPKPKLAVVKND
jgi:hypothetical protein